jgi:anti-anti-sigma factor
MLCREARSMNTTLERVTGPRPDTEPAAGYDMQVVTVAGELDAFTNTPLRLALDEISARSAIVDLTAVTFLDGASARLLVQAAERRRAAGGWLLLCGARPLVARVLAAVDADGLLGLHSER